MLKGQLRLKEGVVLTMELALELVQELDLVLQQVEGLVRELLVVQEEDQVVVKVKGKGHLQVFQDLIKDSLILRQDNLVL